jgi:hypothetical protein
MAEPDDDQDGGLVLTPEQRRRRRARNIAIALALAAVAALFYVMTFYRFGPQPH